MRLDIQLLFVAAGAPSYWLHRIKMSKPVLYSLKLSAPVRTVRLVARAITLDLDIYCKSIFNIGDRTFFCISDFLWFSGSEVDFTKQEQLSSAFRKVHWIDIRIIRSEILSQLTCSQLNPQHTVPVLDDNGTIIWDSHAICTYLIGKYAPDDSLYPKDLVQRAHVDQCLHFDSGVLFTAIRNANFVIFLGGSVVPQEEIDELHSALELLETFLINSLYLTGNKLTVAEVGV